MGRGGQILRCQARLIRVIRRTANSVQPMTSAPGSFAAGSPRPLVHKCPLCINTDRKFWALGFVAMCH